MAGSTFKTNPFELNKLLDDCQRGVLLPATACALGYSSTYPQQAESQLNQHKLRHKNENPAPGLELSSQGKVGRR